MKSRPNQSASCVVDPRVKTPGQTFGAPLLVRVAVPGYALGLLLAFCAPLSKQMLVAA
jgi:hypothetical protein